MNINLSDLIVKNVSTVKPRITVERIRRIMEGNRIGALPVVGPNGHVMGTVTVTGLARQHNDDTPVSYLMSAPVDTIPQFSDVHADAQPWRTSCGGSARKKERGYSQCLRPFMFGGGSPVRHEVRTAEVRNSRARVVAPI